jgi:hypothetical protein
MNNKSNINYQKIGVEELVNISKNIFSICKKTIGAGADPSFVLKNLQNDFKDFAMAYPTVLQHMVMDGLFSTKVFERYLMKIKAAPWKNDDERLEYYAEYYIMLLRHMSRKSRSCGKKAEEWGKIRQEYLSKLKESHKQFFDNCKKIEREVDEENEERLNERRKYIINQIKNLAEERKNEIKNEKYDERKLICENCLADLSVIAENDFIYKYVGGGENDKNIHYYCDSCFMGPAMKFPADEYKVIEQKINN